MSTLRTVATGVCTLWACLAFAFATSPAAAQLADKKVVAAAQELQLQGASAQDVALTVAEKFRQNAGQTTAVLKALGYAGKESGAALSRVFRSRPVEVTGLMMKAAFPLAEIAAGVEGAGARGAETTDALVKGGMRVTDVVEVHKASGRDTRTVVAELRRSGVSVRDLSQAVKDVFTVRGRELTQELVDAGYSPEEVVDAVAEDGTVTPEQMAEYLMYAGVGRVDAAAAVVERMVGKTMSIVIAFLARLLGLGGIADASVDQLAEIGEILKAAGFRVSEVVAGWIGAGVPAERVADALVAGGMAAQDAATAVWGTTKDRIGDAADWLMDKGTDAGELAQWAVSAGWDATTAFLHVASRLEGDVLLCMYVVLALDGGSGDIAGDTILDTCLEESTSEPTEVVIEAERQGVVGLQDGLDWLRQKSATLDELAEVMETAGWTATQAAEWLLDQGYSPEQVWSAIRDQFGASAAAIAQALADAGLPIDQLLSLLISAANLSYDAAMEIIQNLG